MSESEACSICLEPFVDPRMLVCIHTFCRGCLTDHISHFGRKGHFGCPVCRVQMQIPPGGADAFPRKIMPRKIMPKEKKMSRSKLIAAPHIPRTPSRAINHVLQEKFDRSYKNWFEAALPYYICAVFQAITMLYSAIYRDKTKKTSRPSHRMWMISCGLVSSLIVLKAYFIFTMGMGCARILYALLYGGTWLLALFGVGLGVSGSLFFDREGSKSPSWTGWQTRGGRGLARPGFTHQGYT